MTTHAHLARVQLKQATPGQWLTKLVKQRA